MRRRDCFVVEYGSVRELSTRDMVVDATPWLPGGGETTTAMARPAKAMVGRRWKSSIFNELDREGTSGGIEANEWASWKVKYQ
jgi:hypothetical protein